MLAAGLVGARAAAADGGLSVEATLIVASQSDAPSDARLRSVEAKLRKVFGFKHYEYGGGGSASLSLPGEADIDLGNGYRLHLSGADDGGGKIRMAIAWTQGKKGLINTTVVCKRGDPFILGGPSTDAGTLIVSLAAQ